MMGFFKGPLDASRDVMGRMFHSAVNAERQRVEIEFARKFRPVSAFSIIEGVIGLFALADALRRKSWFAYSLAATLLTVAAGHAFIDIQEQKILDLLDEKLS